MEPINIRLKSIQATHYKRIIYHEDSRLIQAIMSIQMAEIEKAQSNSHSCLQLIPTF